MASKQAVCDLFDLPPDVNFIYLLKMVLNYNFEGNYFWRLFLVNIFALKKTEIQLKLKIFLNF